jgi:uncharacterized protein YqgC (DUF456 family)
MDTLIAILAVCAGVFGIIGAIVPGLPGPPVSWVGMLLLYFWGGVNRAGDKMSTTLLLVWLGITILVSVLDYLVPGYFTKVTGGTKYGSRGAIVGLILGAIFIPPFGMIIGAIAGAFCAELYYAQKGTGAAFKSALGAFGGFLFGTGLKFIAACCMMYYIIVYI